ncbi:hypothetical protein [Aquihabitans sp. McL0605]|uniref:hypothetical protein n=1 Tax=Aquihabitans sp. McL0605 TaxID=3415671 RepID=UPI003CF982D5
MSGHADRALPARRAYVVDTEQLAAVVVEIDATEDPQGLAVLQAGLHEVPEGSTLIHGYNVTTAGLGAWIGDRRVRVSIWPALIDAAGEISADDPTDPDADVLVVDIDPLEFGAELEHLVRLGRLIVAGPESGPVPLVVDLDQELLREVVDQASDRS